MPDSLSKRLPINIPDSFWIESVDPLVRSLRRMYGRSDHELMTTTVVGGFDVDQPPLADVVESAVAHLRGAIDVMGGDPALARCEGRGQEVRRELHSLRR